MTVSDYCVVHFCLYKRIKDTDIYLSGDLTTTVRDENIGFSLCIINKT